jgi:hypothetical protein
MEPLSTIELSRCKWFGVLAVSCMVAAELFDLARATKGQRTALASRGPVRQAIRQTRIRTR